MTAKASKVQLLSLGLALALFMLPARAGAIEVKKMLSPGGGGGEPAAAGPGPSMHNPLGAAQQKALQDAIANDSEQFVDQESDKKSSGEPYVDLEHAAFSYIPTNKGGARIVTAKLTGNEYKPRKSDPAARGTPTGKKKSLVFSYRMEGTKFTATEPPKWEDVETAAKK